MKLSQEAISVDVSGAALTASTLSGRGGADTSIDLNNVFAEETRQYYEGQDPESEPENRSPNSRTSNISIRWCQFRWLQPQSCQILMGTVSLSALRSAKWHGLGRTLLYKCMAKRIVKV